MKLPQLTAALALLIAPASAQELRGRTLEQWRALIEPSAEELAFEAIPWRPSFWSAVREAQAGERPILLWVMNGHPLGCT